MFKLNSDKLIKKVKYEVLPEMLVQDAEDIVKYNLLLTYVIKANSFKQLACLTGVTVGTACFFYLTSPILVGAGATMSIAGLIQYVKLHREDVLCQKLFHLLLIGLDTVLEVPSVEVQRLLDQTTVEDLLNFVKNKDICKEEA